MKLDQEDLKNLFPVIGDRPPSYHELTVGKMIIRCFLPAFPTSQIMLQSPDFESGVTLQCGVFSPARKWLDSYPKRYMRLTGNYQVYQEEEDHWIDIQSGKLKISFQPICRHVNRKYCYAKCYQYLAVFDDNGVVVYNYQEKTISHQVSRRHHMLSFSFSALLELNGLISQTGFKD